MPVPNVNDPVQPEYEYTTFKTAHKVASEQLHTEITKFDKGQLKPVQTRECGQLLTLRVSASTRELVAMVDSDEYQNVTKDLPIIYGTLKDGKFIFTNELTPQQKQMHRASVAASKINLLQVSRHEPSVEIQKHLRSHFGHKNVLLCAMKEHMNLHRIDEEVDFE